jgi:murein DD-endopeptidase / murein LD-carboxypeptidase
LIIRRYLYLFASILLLASCHSARQVAYTTDTTPAKTATKNSVTRLDSEGYPYQRDKKPLRRKALKKKYAAILETKKSKIKNKKLYYFIDDWAGVEYKWGGNDQDGVDCSGLIVKLYADVYGRKLQRTVALQHEDTRNFRRQRRFREGDLVYFKTVGDDASHVGVYLKNGYFVHSAKSRGVSIANLNDPYWKKVYAGGGKVRTNSTPRQTRESLSSSKEKVPRKVFADY